MSEKQEFRLCVPAELARRFKGLCIDAGSSILKFVYRSKEDQNEVNSNADSKYGHLHLVMFPRRELIAALDYVRQHSVITGSGDAAERQTIYTTGFGCTQHGNLVSEKLGVQLQQLTEFDCFIKSFTYLAARLPRSEFLEPYLDEAIVEPLEMMKKQLGMFEKAQEHLSELTEAFDLNAMMIGLEQATGKASEAALQAGDVPLSEAEPDMYPCILALSGSGIAFFKVEKDGSSKMMDLSNRGGRAFFGLGSLLTGFKTFSELVDAASKGDPRGVDQHSDDLVETMDAVEGEDSWYTACADETSKAASMLVFCFGKAVGSDSGKFKREDIARSLLNSFVLDLVQCVSLVSTVHGIKRIFFCGGFCSSPLVRSMITAEYLRRNLTLMTFKVPSALATLDFVKPGAHLGALGCVVHDVEQSTSS